MSPLTGQTLADTYKIIRRIGRGGMSVVYEAEHLRLKNRHLAVKVLSAEAATDEAFYLRFQREAEILSELSHPNIVVVQDFARTDQGAPYLVIELLRGETLMQRMRRMGKIPLEESRIVVRQVGAALTYAHGKGVIHRDLKPHNVFLQGEAAAGTEVKLLDFGISTMKQGLQVTRGDGLILGTSAFMSPEQAMGQVSAIDEKSEVFSFLCITGQRPFQGDSDDEIRRRVCHGDPPPPTSRVAYLPRSVDGVFARALDRHKHRRHHQVEEFVADFFQALGPMGEAGESEGLRVTLPLAELRDGARKGMEVLEDLAEELAQQAAQADAENPDDEPTEPRRPTGKQVQGLKAVPTGMPAIKDPPAEDPPAADAQHADPRPGSRSFGGILVLLLFTLLIIGASLAAWMFLR